MSVSQNALHVTPGVVAAPEAYTDALRLVEDRRYFGEACAAFRSLGLVEEADTCKRLAVDAERQLIAHANAALAGSWA